MAFFNLPEVKAKESGCVFYFPCSDRKSAQRLKRLLWKKRAKGELPEFRIDFYADDLFLIVKRDCCKFAQVLPAFYLSRAFVRKEGALKWKRASEVFSRRLPVGSSC